MDLSVIKDALSNFSTFIDNIVKLFQGVPNTLGTLSNWFSDGNLVGDNWVKNPEVDGKAPLNISKHWDVTEGIFKKDTEGNN
ncbi:hypothetical protein CPHO_10765 [Corynebacterium phocae]|uniref:Uncharacterized protein n=1 Tax=Corynebacterium phocae TaxID=161895 RepID=A0A1L7D5T1_9CORY|nr:PorH family porin [Corynebacterium phocae]APT93292.1 hypothetical protein CPHO_10765 [Corynebacterium phocae]KAA8721621.1 hypothetical protein F4V58_10240 [Corynebacterium phocae]